MDSEDNLSIHEFSSIYANASLHYGTRLLLRDSLETENPNLDIVNDRNNSINEMKIPSYVFEKQNRNCN